MSPSSHLLTAFGGVIATSLLVVLILGWVTSSVDVIWLHSNRKKIQNRTTRSKHRLCSIVVSDVHFWSKVNPFKVTVRYCKRRTKLKRQKNEEKQKMRELLFGSSPNNYMQPSPNAPPPTYQHSYSTPVYHHQLDNFNGFNPTMRYSMRSERGLPIS